jgi:hypothetical protein
MTSSERRIGGEMEITVGQLRVAPTRTVWPNFAKHYALQCDTGRSALRLALFDWMRAHAPGAVVWLPSYICPSVSEVIAGLGLAVRSYPDRPGLKSWLQPPTPGHDDIVIVLHYFGLINRPALSWVDSRPKREWGLIEDCVQAPYSAGAGTRGEYAIASLRKWWPAPDGAIVCSRQPIADTRLAPPREDFISQRLAAKLVRGNHGSEVTYLKWIEESEQLLSSIEPRRVSWISTQLLESVDPESAAALRCQNWSVLLQGMKTLDAVRPLFSELVGGEVPLGFPVTVSAGMRDKLRAFLMQRHVFCPIHWRLANTAFPTDRGMSENMLTIPLDQRYGTADMQLVLAHIGEFQDGQ